MQTQHLKTLFIALFTAMLAQLVGGLKLELLEPSQQIYDILNKENNFTKSYRIVKKKPNENVEVISLDSLNVNMVISAKYTYNNEEVNFYQEYVFTSLSNHLFLTETLQRKPSQNKRLIQLYMNSTLIGYVIKVSLSPSISKPTSSEQYEFALSYYRDEDVDNLVDGTLTQFNGMLPGDIEWKKISFTVETTEAMIFTLENGYETEIFMYSSGAGNMTQKQFVSPQLVSKYSFSSAKGVQMIFILFRRVYMNQTSYSPSIVNFSLSIFSIYSESSPSLNENIKSLDDTWKSTITSQYASGVKAQTSSEQYKLSLFKHPFSNFDVKLPIFNIQKLFQSNFRYYLLENPPYLNQQSSSSTKILVYELIIPIFNYTAPYFLAATATSCNSHFKYSINPQSEPFRGDLKLSDDDLDEYFSDKFSNIDLTSTTKIFVHLSEYKPCAPSCVLHAALHIEILVDPSLDMSTFKLQGNQLLHSLSNQSNPFFDFLPLMSYTFFKVELEEDLNQLTIQYYSGFDKSYILFKHSFQEEESDKDDVIVVNFMPPAGEGINDLQEARNLQFDKIVIDDKKENFDSDSRPIQTNILLPQSTDDLYQSGQMIIKPAKKGVHIFSALNLSPTYSPFTIQANSLTLRQITSSSYISIALNGQYDIQSLFYDKVYVNDKEILLKFESDINNISIFANYCNQTTSISSCQIPLQQSHVFQNKIQQPTNNSAIPDLCPNNTCHILFSIQYTPFVECTASKSNEQDGQNQLETTKTFYLSLHEIESPTNKHATNSTNSTKSDSHDTNTLANSNHQQFLALMFSILLMLGAISLAALICYFKKKENHLIREIELLETEKSIQDDANKRTSVSQFILPNMIDS